jgi:NosR/NirI family transcriptional regulator, nitrous oxide reductase regulator
MMFRFLGRYTKWLHGRWPAGTVEKLPQVDQHGRSDVPGLYIVGDLTGIPLLKFSADTGARAIEHIVADTQFQQQRRDKKDGILDVAVVGAGVSGMAAALAARKAELDFVLFEATEPFSTLANFPKGKPIYTYPTEMVPAGDLRFNAQVKEPLVAELKEQTLGQGIEPRLARIERIERHGDYLELVVPGGEPVRARRVVVGIGRSGNFRKLGVEGEDLDKVSNRLHDPQDFGGRDVLVVGGGDSALEAAIAVAQAGARVTVSYRKPEFARPKPENIEKLQALSADPMADVAIETPSSERVTTSSGHFLEEGRRPGSISLMMASQVRRIEADVVELESADGDKARLPNDAVLSMIGREAPLDFFRRSGVSIRGEMGTRQWVGLGLFTILCLFIYNWKAGGDLTEVFKSAKLFPFNVPDLMASLSASAGDLSSLIGVLSFNLGKPGFYYSLLYSALVVVFGYKRVKDRPTPYVRAQTLSLAAFQIVPLFLLPYIVLPWLGHNGFFDAGWAKSFADAFFPEVDYDHGREYWRAFGFVLAWPLFIWNVFTEQPMWSWLAVSLVQTFVVIPLIVYFWGKGAYCGWVCSCGALAETLGDKHRHKMPHGAGWNKANMLGQAILALCFLLLATRVVSWIAPDTGIGQALKGFYGGLLYGWQVLGIQLNYRWTVDLLLAGVVGYGAYFWYSGRVWCRFACPLAALMHIYARFGRFRILADKKKCISCNVCTSVCHQGIDVMNFANKGLPMADPECVRCSACVESCPTGVLQFGQVDPKSGETLKVDGLEASPVRLREKT